MSSALACLSRKQMRMPAFSVHIQFGESDRLEYVYARVQGSGQRGSFK